MAKEILLEDIEASERFLEELEEYIKDYDLYLGKQYSKNTVTNHIVIVDAWCEYICGYEPVKGFEDIKPGMLGNKFYKNIRYDHDTTPVFAKNAVIRFLNFIWKEYGVGNVQLLEKLSRK